ncbi:hypothetical protein CCM_07708 [Cordyceps militaris CM01]|uniref:Uncharacterized protein n=1 Tax=Cordyceps militaris (strain CM01) TaxID=983644 RepID=G3JQF2_CORMM|nr:uncharacterized protein CCM_07708 [Cordyceps militaris CM01]EGX89456.1 hypothetical protein CCM_07708 [Cordyceps militaris CM01]
MSDLQATQHPPTYHDSPYYAYLIQTYKGNGAGDWHRWLVAAACREDMKTFFRGLQKYSATSNATITDVKPVNLAWWTFKAPEGYNVRELVKQIYQSYPSWYGDIAELSESLGKIAVTVMDDAGGRNWPILPTQNVSLYDY